MEAERRRIAEALPAYEITGEIGRGAWGVVYAGRHRQLGRAVAIKQLPTAFGADPGLRARFASEAQLIASLDHPHIVPVYDYLERDGLYLIVMEHLSGGTLWDRFSGEGLAQDQAVAILLAVCAALDHAHEQGVLHRDVKPENVLLGASGTPKLTDFGIAKLLSSTRTALTVAGTAMGTPAYMAPEQARAGELGPWTDVYSCGVMLYELLSGTLPFPESTDPVVQLYQKVHEPPTSLASVAPGIPAGICEVTMKALATDPDDRYPTAAELGVALAEAATAAWAPGWVGPTGITVMDRGRITSVTERPIDTRVRRASSPTVIVRGPEESHPPLEPVEPLAEVVGLDASADTPTEVAAPEPPAEPEAEPPGSGDRPARVLTPLPRTGDDGPRRPRWQAIGAIAAVVVLVAAGASWALRRDSGGGEGASASSTTVPAEVTTTTRPPKASTTTTTTTAPPPEGRYLTLDSIRVEDGRYVVEYTPYRFEPDIDDASAYHVHFFWDTYTPEQAGLDAPERGVTVGLWELWDLPVFDAFAVADRPPGAQRICAVVATHHHLVDDPANAECIDLPS